ncbi:type I polyketide synthase [Spirosoma rigui]|uniref:type I polyketide synthase n=1 Tax=Spirosoma rigui TaxID=564064 RepID=UPI0009B0CBAE|nr:type I polyketide synthase [Spirosoma rigui]
MHIHPDVDTELATGTPLLVHHLVEQAVKAHQERVAVVFGNEKITYDQLNQRADALCQAVLHQAPDADLVGVSATRSLDMVVGVLAILKAGKAYLPLDPAYPRQRLQQLVTDSGLTVCVATEVDRATFEPLGLAVVLPGRDLPATKQTVLRQNPIACVLYTSGSTGKPKGVCLGHAGLINLLNWQLTHSAAAAGLRTLQFCHLSFDASFQELFVPLLSGGTLYLVDDSYRLDAGRLLQFIDTERISRVFLPYVVLQYLAETADAEQKYPTALVDVITGGELLKITPQIARFFAALPNCTLTNVYGPTEASVWVTENKLKGDALNWPAIPSIGKPIAGLDVFILDEQGQPVPDGVVGELCISGVCLALGYLNQPALTAEKFSRYNHPQRGSVNLYRTGDLARYQPDGSLDFQGRKDGQVKIRGNRVEVGEIEVVLAQQPGVQQAVVVAREDSSGAKILIAYVIATPETDTKALRSAIEEQLPDFMIPANFVRLEEFPRTSSGKVDRNALPAPERRRPDTVPYQKPRTALEKIVTELWASLLQFDTIGVADNFFELGGNSLLAQKTVAGLKQKDYTLPITRLYQYPTAAAIARYLEPAVSGQPARSVSPSPQAALAAHVDVAVIGMAGRFPGASTIDQLWEVLKQGRETTRFFSPDELDPTIPEHIKNDPLYVPARGIIDNADQFDALFFGLTPKLAELMDPQQRVFLEIAWETLEQTGYLPQHYNGRVGVFAGCGNNTYYLNNVLGNQSLIDQIGAFQVMTVNEKDYIASRTAYQLNLTGPAVSVYSACSTSLLAITQAVQSIRSGQCEVALAGGASITAPVNSGHLYQEGAMLSRDGHCNSFDADAKGTVFSDGAGVVLLKSAAAAQRDGDTIYALIKGVGVNNDGGGKGSFTAPNADGQAGAISMAIADAGIDPATISYVETHGTGTPVGDPIEIDGLVSAFGEQTERQFCAIGSVKSNMGHLTQAAGVVGFIKATLALHNRQIPASLGFRTPNPAIDFANSPFFVNTKLTDWSTKADQPRRAGVSSFGVGGTNVHVVLEEAPVDPSASAVGQVAAAPERPVQLITWSAKTPGSRDTYAGLLANALTDANAPALADVAFTLQTTRADFGHRRFVLATSTAELVSTLRQSAEVLPATKSLPDEVVFLFPGQGAQYLNMGRTFYEREVVFREAVDTCAEQLLAHLDVDIRSVMYPGSVDAEAEQRLKNTRYTQPALFVTEYAMARLWMSWGVRPTVFCGHSIGEFVAAHLAGVFSLADALTLIAARGRMVSGLPRGSMLSVRMDADAVQTMMPPALSMAAVNSRNLCVVAGPDEYIADFARLLDEKDIPNRLLQTSHAFHSAMMDPIVSQFEAIVSGISLSRPQQPLVSTVTGGYMTDAQATDPHYWANHLRQTVRFADAVDTLSEQENLLLLEVGPGGALATLVRQQLGKRPATVLTSLPTYGGPPADYLVLLKTLGQIWMAGLTPDWKAFYNGQPRRIVKLPAYAFDRKRCWVNPVIRETVTRTNPQLPIAAAVPIEPNADIHTTSVLMRKDLLIDKVKEILEDASGIDMDGVTPDMTFLEIGLDSLLLTQVSLTFKREFGLPITFRQLTGDYATPGQLVDYLDQNLPADAYQPAPVAAPAATPVSVAPAMAPVPAAPVYAPAPAMPMAASPEGESALSLIAQQLQLLGKQLALLQGNAPAQVVAPVPAAPIAQPPVAAKASPAPAAAAPKLTRPDLSPEEEAELKKPFGATARIERQASGLSDRQHDFLQQITAQYNQKTGGSKAYAQQNRGHMADPRVVSGFRPLTKEIVYPLVINRSKGSRLWDIDGNEYIDVLNGFGSNMFGYQPDLIKQALHEQVENGFEVGPQHELAGEVSRLVCELTGADRSALCSTGSEAVLGTMRIARTVTGRSLIVAFSGSYHGIVDEVIIRGTKKLKSYPAAPGIMPESVQNMLILDYGTEESLKIIRERAHELAAVLVEPVQSRRPEFVPIDFLKEVRAITAASGTALIFDEIITGFRMHPGGTQALFGIKADLASYGKVVGAGLPIGVIAGKREFMDALDGGFWQYGDASVPEVGVTYFAGTFVRHPLALAAARASLQYMKEAGPALQQGLSLKTTRLANTLNAVIDQRGLPFHVVHYGSLWKVKFSQEVPYNELLFTLMREKGIHIWDGFPCFMTEAHTDAEMDTVVQVFTQSVDELIDAGFFAGSTNVSVKKEPAAAVLTEDRPPVPGARLGRDQQGNPAWFMPNPDYPGKYMQVELT